MCTCTHTHTHTRTHTRTHTHVHNSQLGWVEGHLLEMRLHAACEDILSGLTSTYSTLVKGVKEGRHVSSRIALLSTLITALQCSVVNMPTAQVATAVGSVC